MSIFFSGTDSEKSYITKLAFKDSVAETFLGRKSFWQLEKCAIQNSADVQVSVATRPFAWFAPVQSQFFVPTWLDCEADLDRESVTIGKTKSRRRQIRQIQRNNFSYSVTTNQEQLLHFYNDMYLPLLAHSHGEAALAMKCDHMLDLAKHHKAELVLIHQDNEVVAGSFIVYEHGRPRLFSEGVLNADKRYFRAGVGSAIYLFSYQYLAEKGFSRVNMGRCRAFINDGVFYFKRRFGLEVIGDLGRGMLIKKISDSASAREFFISNPFVQLKRGRFSAVAFRDHAELSKISAPEEIIEHQVKGLGNPELLSIQSI
ncbi:MAG: hypothetical protein AAF420_11225 [Pseudomonadota bacterium]